MTEKRAAIDIGNTFTKVGIFQGDALIEHYGRVKVNEIGELIAQEKVDCAIVANVGSTVAHLVEEWKAICPIIEVSAHLSLPFRSLYLTPETLGADRIALVAGAKKLYPDLPCLCVDAGTCLTIDLVTAEAVYMGGSISPGIRMRLRAMHEYTTSLPLITEVQKTPIVGNSTTASMLSGAINGAVAELRYLSSEYLVLYPNIKVIVTGGDAHLLANDLPEYMSVNPHLVLIGLNAILQYNNQLQKLDIFSNKNS